jgi:hypothetical protein
VALEDCAGASASGVGVASCGAHLLQLRDPKRLQSARNPTAHSTKYRRPEAWVWARVHAGRVAHRASPRCRTAASFAPCSAGLGRANEFVRSPVSASAPVGYIHAPPGGAKASFAYDCERHVSFRCKSEEDLFADSMRAVVMKSIGVSPRISRGVTESVVSPPFAVPVVDGGKPRGVRRTWTPRLLLSSSVQTQSWPSPSETDFGVTILMPCLNEMRTLPRCIAACQLLREEYPLRVEVLISDHGSAGSGHSPSERS